MQPSDTPPSGAPATQPTGAAQATGGAAQATGGAAQATGAASESSPDDISRMESGEVSTSFDPGTAGRLKRGVAIAAAALLLGFVVVRVVRFFDERAVANAGEAAYAAPPPVDVVVAQAVTA